MRSAWNRFWIVALVLAWGTGAARADLATIYLKDGQARTVELVAADRGQIQWKASSSSGEVQSTLRSRIDYVVFPTTEIWRDAEEAFESGNLPAAVTKYRLVIADPASHYFPFPGNYVSLAKERLLRCFQLQMNAEQIAKQAQIVREEFSNLPPDLRKVDPAVTAWTALAKQDWEGVLKVLEKVERPGPEVYYLRGRALEATGKREEAIREYAGAYVLNFGGTVSLTRAALQRSSVLMGEMGDQDQIATLKAQVKLYRDLYGMGSLWEGASEQLMQLADAEIGTIGKAEGNLEKPQAAMATEGGTVVKETATVATTVPVEERNFLLVDEIDERVFLVGYVSENSQPKLNGVVETDEGYTFGETAGGILIGAFSGKDPVYEIRTKFVPARLDGIVFDMNDRTVGGMGLYLKEGTLLFAYVPRRGSRKVVDLGRVEKDALQSISIRVRGDGKVTAKVNGEESEHAVPKGGLKLRSAVVVSIGYAGEGRIAKGLAIKEPFLPFRGTLQHFSISTGASLAEAVEGEVKRFGKRVLLVAPGPAAPEAKTEPEGKAPEGKAPEGGSGNDEKPAKGAEPAAEQ